MDIAGRSYMLITSRGLRAIFLFVKDLDGSYK